MPSEYQVRLYFLLLTNAHCAKIFSSLKNAFLLYLWLIKWRNGCKWLFQWTALPSKMLYMVWMSWHNHLRINVLQKPPERFTFKTCSQFSSIVQLSGLIKEKNLDHFISYYTCMDKFYSIFLRYFHLTWGAPSLLQYLNIWLKNRS